MQKMLYLLLLTLSIVSLNCSYIQYKYTYTNNGAFVGSTKRNIPIYIDKTFSTTDKLAIDNAISQWNYALNGQIKLRVVNYNFDMEPTLIMQSRRGQGWLILKVNSDNYAIPDDVPYKQCKLIKGCVSTLAWADRVGGSVIKVIRDRISADAVETITLHEMGPLLSLTHNEADLESLMYPRYGKLRYLCIDYDSVMRVANAYGLNLSLMNYCVTRY